MSASGSSIGVTYRVFRGSRLIATGRPACRLRPDGTVRFVARFKPAPGATYKIEMDAGDVNGNHATATYSLATRGNAARPRTG